ncbi:MAG TPA: glucose 1-dehydrogenase [Candidatus Limnocylindrales bacterium]|nr:glucose 1-dehydrogenase [Candidatus Limnocylindrales bacterium]
MGDDRLAGRLNGKAAIVTGGSRGIGRAIALRLAADGAAVAVNYAHAEAPAREVAQAIEERGGQAAVIQADMGSVEQVRRLFREATARFGRIDIVVNNAATAMQKSIVETSEEDFERVFGVNTRGPYFAMQEAARVLPDHGRIVNISSGATTVGFAGQSVYCASKAALEQLTLVCANELASRQITVNAVLVGPTETEMFGNLERTNPAFRTMIVSRTPMGRIADPADIADVVAFLASDDARWITGQSIRVDGGAR